ncbi:hypothetical protein PR048_026141 [Dryococelus australis]|uniref:Uncharacterized protein n=1 Tax=Dryococelus australis TaxID=614101 RepID=A0ABQ9GKI4_9NEOP|nr:hypothetical protein PR048_026141 [Dryococelus australis]
MEGQKKWENPEKTCNQRHRSARFPLAEIREATPLGIEPGSPRWNARSLITTPSRPLQFKSLCPQQWLSPSHLLLDLQWWSPNSQPSTPRSTTMVEPQTYTHSPTTIVEPQPYTLRCTTTKVEPQLYTPRPTTMVESQSYTPMLTAPMVEPQT